jgi:ligand-binding sensor domain-containing protein/serine phosphatase RsbU (regulator of sigma subunit)
MKLKIKMKIIISTFWCLFLFSGISFCQTFSFRNWGAESNIPSGFIYTIDQSDDGFLWLGTGNGISRFDGFSFFNVQYPDTVSGRYPTTSIKDKQGTIWYGCSDGSLFYTKNNHLIQVPISNSRSISALVQGPNDKIYVLPQGQMIFEIDPSKPLDVRQFPFNETSVIFSASFTKNGRLLIGTQENINVCRLEKDSIIVESTIEGFDYSGVMAIKQTNDSSNFIIGTDGNGLFQLKFSERGNILTRIVGNPEWALMRVQSISEDSERNIWVSTFGDGVIQLRFTDNFEKITGSNSYNTASGLSGNDVKLVYHDVEGNYWFGLFGEGISLLSSYAFRYFTPGSNSLENNILFIRNIGDKYLLGTPSGYHIFDLNIGKSVAFTNLSRQVGNMEITAYYIDDKENLWIGTAGNGLYLKGISGNLRQFFRSGDSGTDNIKDIDIDNQNVWLATTNGVIVLDRQSGEIRQRFDLNNGLPHNSINSICVDRTGNAYIGTESDRLYIIDRDFKISSCETSMYGNNINKVLGFSQSKKGSMWVATKGNGVFDYEADTVKTVNRTNGLMSNYCYSILSDSEENVWIGHEKGFSRYIPSTGIMRVFGTEFVKSGICNPDGMYESNDKIFIGTTEGMVVYNRNDDKKKSIAPFTSVNYITINDERYDYKPQYTLPYNKKYIIKIYYSGINFNAPEKVYFSTYLSNYDNDWSKLSASRETIYNLSDGKYKFSLMSVNDEGLSTEKSTSFEIIIKKPFWRTWWFIILIISGISGIVVLIIRQRDTAQKKIQDYLEKELDARTSVVMKQKGEIELQNIEITDSINYAKRIQSSILPDIGKLKETFADAFILFHPRDIVSGDFYWFDKIGDEKFILVCADSTGHGVPGAFMSMIGSTLLQDIVSRQGITKPSEILSLLDKQIFSTLNQNVELGVSNDGMDMVVCEFNIKTRYIRFASAMRPIIIVIEGEPYYIKGNRLSIGGESVIEKFYDDQEYYLNEGDTVYLFSDGLPDQFGGTDGKKLKIARLKRIIEQVARLPMDEQKEIISKFFFDWKGDHEQVDDILLMGVKV